ncbi:MAG: phosphoribosylformylglycinamidine synthase [Deltaproteobacteria bacterium]|nr:MAG: phosphoribosylformylglycinamidine synthase [Deltaproteobacteria bacterium]
MEKKVKAIVLTGYGLNCDYETDYSFKIAGIDSRRIHINDLISNKSLLRDFHIIAFIGGFSWADHHGAGVLLAAKLKKHIFDELIRFIEDGKLIIGICNGFQTLVNLGILPAVDMNYWKREVALISNDSGNFIDKWVRLKINTRSPCVFTKGIDSIELPIRHGEGKFFAKKEVIDKLFKNNQVVLQYEENPNGSLKDIAGICDPTGRILGLMPHPEAYNHFTNHPDWPRTKKISSERGDGIIFFKNAAEYVKKNLL